MPNHVPSTSFVAQICTLSPRAAVRFRKAAMRGPATWHHPGPTPALVVRPQREGAPAAPSTLGDDSPDGWAAGSAPMSMV